jgi:signal transduction histidine kinase
VLLILLPATALLLYTPADQRRAASRRGRDGAARLAVFASNAQREYIDATRQLLTALAALPSIRDADATACQPLVGRLLELYPRYVNIGLLVLGIVAAVTLVIGWVASDLFILRRVRALVSATRRLSAGDFHTRSGLAHGGGELGQLAQAFDQMAESLQQAEERRALEEELRRKNYELEQQNLAIQEANRLKSEFVSMVSHELRTPLTSIGGYTELLLERDAAALSPDARQSLGIVKTNADRLLKMINDLLDLSRMEAGKIELRRAAVDLRPLIVGVGESLRPLIDARRQRLRLDLPADLPAVWADADRVEQIITNLVANAHKYTPAEGSITVGARRDDGSVRVDVSDTGAGLSAEEREQLFTRFFRAPGTRRVAGSGLGLVITRLLVELHGGRIGVSSAPGEGSVFSVWLPVSDPTAT